MSALPTDFNDLGAAQGLAAVREQLEPVIQGVADWPVPILTAAEPPAIQADSLPAWLGRYVGALAQATQTPATMSAMFALSVVSACVQRRYLVAPLGSDAGYTEPATFWSLSVAASGSRKSAIVDALVGLDAASAVLPEGLPDAWVQAVTAAGVTVFRDDPELSHAELNLIAAVVTTAAVGMADSGTIALDHGLGQGRRALSLLPDCHVCVVRSEQVGAPGRFGWC